MKVSNRKPKKTTYVGWFQKRFYYGNTINVDFGKMIVIKK